MAIPCSWFRPKSSIPPTWLNRFGRAPISKSRMTPRVGILRLARRGDVAFLEDTMRRTTRAFPFYLTILMGVILFGQAGLGQGATAGQGRPSPGFDMSLYSTPVIHDHAMDRATRPDPPHSAR